MNTRNGGEIGTLVTLMRCDMRIPVKPEITQWQKHHNMMEILDYAARESKILFTSISGVFILV
jgi:hypothetical protein